MSSESSECESSDDDAIEALSRSIVRVTPEDRARIMAHLPRVPARKGPRNDPCPICFEEKRLVSFPDNDDQPYTHLVCCSKHICDDCMENISSSRCPFCNQEVGDLLRIDQTHPSRAMTRLRDMVVAGTLRNDEDSMYTLSNIVVVYDSPLAEALMRAAARRQFQPAILAMATLATNKIVENKLENFFPSMIRNGGRPDMHGAMFRREALPWMRRVYPCQELSSIVEKMCAIDKEIREVAVKHRLVMRCAFCRAHNASHACACGKVSYCGPACQARHWEDHACPCEAVQLVGLASRAYNGASGARVAYVEKKGRYKIRVGEESSARCILVRPENVHVLAAAAAAS